MGTLDPHRHERNHPMLYAPEHETPAPPRAVTGWCANPAHPPALHRHDDDCQAFLPAPASVTA